jgi:hypothetical protein
VIAKRQPAAHAPAAADTTKGQPKGGPGKNFKTLGRKQGKFKRTSPNRSGDNSNLREIPSTSQKEI